MGFSPMKDTFLGEKRHVPRWGTSRWFKTNRRFFSKGRCISHAFLYKKRPHFCILLHLLMQFIFQFVIFHTTMS